MRILTSDDDAEIIHSLKQILSSTNKLGLIHESINSHDAAIWTRQWYVFPVGWLVVLWRVGWLIVMDRFSWANGLFGQMMLDLRERKPHLLRLSYQ